MKSQIKTLSLVLLLALMSNFSLNAQKCNYVQDEKDALTGEIQRTSRIWYYSSDNIMFKRSNDQFFIVVNQKYGMKTNFNVPIGNELKVKLGNGTVLSLKTEKEHIPTHNVGADGVVSYLMVQYSISKEQLMQISESGISFIRFKPGDIDPVDREFKGKKIEKIKEKSRCILMD